MLFAGVMDKIASKFQKGDTNNGEVDYKRVDLRAATSDDDEELEEEARFRKRGDAEIGRGDGKCKVFRAKSAPPQDLSFVCPAELPETGNVCIQGPHGPLLIPLPEGTVPGERVTMRLGPMMTPKVQVPDDWVFGEQMPFEGPDGAPCMVDVPEGMKAGDIFEVAAPTMMVQVPVDCREGDQILFETHDGRELMVKCPPNLQPGHYFAALTEDPPEDNSARAG